MFRVHNLSFCNLGDQVIVLEPNRGIYFSLSPRAADFLQTLPLLPAQESDRSAANCEVENVPEDLRGLLTSFFEAGLICIDGNISAVASPNSKAFSCHPEISEWGMVSELTQAIGSSAPPV